MMRKLFLILLLSLVSGCVPGKMQNRNIDLSRSGPPVVVSAAHSEVWTISLESFDSESDARQMISNIDPESTLKPFISANTMGGKTVFYVQSGRYSSRNEAQKEMSAICPEHGLDGCRVEQLEAPKYSNRQTQSMYLQDRYFIVPGDTIEIRFPYHSELSDEFVVRPDGRVSLAFIGSVLAAGKTPEQLQDDIILQYRALSEKNAKSKGERVYRIQVGDELEIKFAYKPELDESAVVRPDGKISLSLVGAITVVNKSPEDLGRELVKKYSKHIDKPRLVVKVNTFASERYYVNGQAMDWRILDIEKPVVILRTSAPMRVFIGGEVKNPGFFPYTGPTSAMQAIIMAGGHNVTGEMGQVIIIRRGRANAPKLFLRNMRSDMWEYNDTTSLEEAIRGDVELQPYDVVIVPKTNIAKVNDYLHQYLWDLVPTLGNSSFGFVYNINRAW